MSADSGVRSTNRDQAEKLPWLSLAASIMAISVAGAGFGHSLPLFSFLLESYGASDVTIGLNTAFAAISALICAPYYPKVIAKIGLKAFIIACLIIMVVPYMLVFWAGDRIIWWYPLRFIFSVGGAGLFAASEIWVNGIAPDRLRGKIIGVYATCLALGFALGPLLLNITGYEGFLPFLAGALVFSSAAIPLFFVRAPIVADEDSGSIFTMLAHDPVLFTASAMFAAVEGAMLIFLPVLAMEIGHGVGVGAQSLTVYGLGILAAQLPIGQLADQFPPRKVVTWCAILGASFALFVPVVQQDVIALYAVLFVWGGMVGGLYTAGLVVIGNTFKGTALAAANTAFVFAYAGGAVLGPLFAGAIRQLFGPQGLAFGIAIALGAYALAAWRSAATISDG
ncbi:MAG: MFS transporter [Pseudomonadota bacterium]